MWTAVLASLLLAAPPAEFGAAHVFVADHEVDAVAEYRGDGTFVGWHGKDDPNFPQFTDPYGLAFGPDGRLYICSDTTGDLFVLSPQGIVDRRPGDGTLLSPRDLTFGPRGRLFVASHDNDRIVEFDVSLAPQATHPCPPGFGQPTACAFDPQGRLWVGSAQAQKLFVLDLADDSLGPTLPLPGAPAGIGFVSTGWVLVAAVPAANVLGFFDALQGTQGNSTPGPTPYDVATLPHAGDELYLFRGTDTVSRVGFGPFGQVDFGPDELEDPVRLAVSPWRFKVTLSGRAGSNDVGPAPVQGMKIHEKAKLSLYPGQSQVFLSLDPQGTLASPQWFGESLLVLTGSFASFINDKTKKGATTPDLSHFGEFSQSIGAPVEAPLANLTLVHRAKPDGFERIVKAPTGTLLVQLSTALGERFFRGKIKNAKPLNEP